MAQLPMESPTDITDEIVPSVFHRELEKNYGHVPPLPTESPTQETEQKKLGPYVSLIIY